jgi:hypothetical protein
MARGCDTDFPGSEVLSKHFFFEKNSKKLLIVFIRDVQTSPGPMGPKVLGLAAGYRGGGAATRESKRQIGFKKPRLSFLSSPLAQYFAHELTPARHAGSATV